MEQYTNQIFGINYSELREMLQNHFGGGITSIQYEVTGNKVSMPGICGEYIIPSIKLIKEKTSETVLIFARRQLKNTESKQAHHYLFLGQRGISVPKLYGSIIDGNNCEILLMEYAREITDEHMFFSSEKNIYSFIDLAAQLSSVVPTLEYIGLIGKDMGGKSDTRDWKTWMPWSVHILGKVWKLAGSDKLGKELKELCQPGPVLTELQKIAYAMIKKIGGFNIGIVHSDFKPNNMVLLPDDDKLALIDFEDIIIDTRYYDIARFLGAPDILFKWDARLRDDYINFFIKQCGIYGNKKLNHEILKRELFYIWYTRSINLWEWLPGEYGGPSYDFWPAGKNIHERCRNLYTLLNALIENMGKIKI
ncbi:MAG: aminoglycoside phosphotransferase family protein [Spirochaetales bacterium]|nr:aminoglycoside phosphotransferase family protein [Spirochaetales bacterium]